MGPQEHTRRKESFDAVASDYDRYRSGFPDQVVDHIVAAGHVSDRARVLEIGCGTGQLSVPLARTGAELVAVERGANLAAFASRNLALFPRARVEVAAFEDWPLPPTPFDVVVAANAFHWVDPGVRFSKSAEALTPGGYLVLAHALHVAGGTPGFFADTQPSYLRWGVSDDPHFALPTPGTAPLRYPELDVRPEYGAVRRERFVVPRVYTTASYVGWLKTDSSLSALDERSRQGFLDDIGRLIETRYAGSVQRNWLYEVVTAQKTA
jgi:SAM-dependent methyltransferase